VEGIYWLRLGGIMALLFGSIYVLLPTFLQEDLESRLATAAGEVDTTEVAGPDLDIAFEVKGGEGQAVADALEARLDAAGVPTTGVAFDGSRVVVDLAPGADRADIVRLASRRGAPSLFAVPVDAEAGDQPVLTGLPEGVVAWLGTLPPAEQAGLADALRSSARTDVAPDAVALDSSLQKVQAGGEGDPRVKLSAPLPEGNLAALVAIDDTVTGVVYPSAEGLRFAQLAREVGGATLDDPDALALLVAGPLPGQLQEVPETETPAQAEEEAPEEQVAASSVPDWLLGMLPDTSMNLGLDLQGGIDLTLQVDLQEAVLGQVARDTTFLADRASKEGLNLDVRPVHSQPVMELSSDAPLSELSAFMRQEFQGDYVYSESDGTIHLFEMADTRKKAVEDQSIEQVLETLRKRVDETGVKEPSIVKKGGGRINVQLPGMVDVKSAVDAIGTTAILEFRMVDEEFDDAVLQEIINKAADALPEDQFLDDELLNVWLWDRQQALLDRDRIILWEYETEADGTQRRLRALPLMNKVLLTGNDVNDAGVGWDQNQIPYVSMEFKPRGGQIFCDVTGEAVGKRFAIILDDQIMSAPSIRERICGGAARIEMSSSAEPMKEAKTLALVLRTGALDAPVVVASVRHVGATLGADSIRSGSLAAGIGSMVVLVFMALWYRTSGLIADFALVVNILLVLGCLALFGATLTLPGIAGIALTAGMAVDANIIIYERIREELRLGVHPRKAVDVGFDKAVVAVLDANITTAIAGIVLFSYGTGPIKGFAVTLLIGIITTLVSALFVTRTLMELVTRSSAARLRI
jgi:preprotein translocase subunit SecD